MPSASLRVHLHVHLRQRLAAGGVGHLQLAVVLRAASRPSCVGVVRHRTASCRPAVTSTSTFLPVELRRQRDRCACSAPPAASPPPSRSAGSMANCPPGLLHERVAAEEQLHVHQVVVDLHRLEVLPGEVDRLARRRVNSKPGSVAASSPCCWPRSSASTTLPALPSISSSCADDRGEGVPPAVHRVARRTASRSPGPSSARR